MECSKNNCDNVLCDRYADGIGYICYDCFNELKKIQKYNPLITIEDIKNWLDAPKRDDRYVQPLINLDELFQMS